MIPSPDRVIDTLRKHCLVFWPVLIDKYSLVYTELLITICLLHRRFYSNTDYPASWRSEEHWMFSLQRCLFVCLWVCQHDNFRMSKHRKMKLGDNRCTVQKSWPNLNLGVIAPCWVRTPKNVVFGYDVGKSSAQRLEVVDLLSLQVLFLPSTRLELCT